MEGRFRARKISRKEDCSIEAAVGDILNDLNYSQIVLNASHQKAVQVINNSKDSLI